MSKPSRISGVQWRRAGRRLTVIGCALLLAGCYRAGPNRFNPYLPGKTKAAEMETVSLTNQLSPEWLKSPTELFRLGPGDRLEIELLGDPTSRTQATVGPDGKIYFNLLSGLDVWGLTLAETKGVLERELAKFIRDQTTVTITLRAVESKRVWLLGRLQSPGVYTMATPMTVLEAIALAGGTITTTGAREGAEALTGEDLADLRRAFIIRKGQWLPVDFYRLLHQGDLSQNIYLQPDDFVYLPSATAREVYVLGAVAAPRAVPYMKDLTFVGAIAHASGSNLKTYFIPEAAIHQVTIVRGSLTQPRVAVVDYKAIATGQAPDILLEPQDIVYVPFTNYRYVTRYIDLVIKSFVSTVAINEGANAAIKNANATSVVVPIGVTPTPVTPVVPVTPR